MILSVSRRTDIPAFYAEWFVNRLQEGYVLVRNPMNYHQVSKVSLSASVIDCIVFWTKNGAPLLRYLGNIAEKMPFYFQYTLNAYSSDIEPHLPSFDHRIATIKELSAKIGNSKVVWRYDPILITDTYTVDWHIQQYEKIAKHLHGVVSECVISFIDIYDKVKKNIGGLNLRACTAEEIDRIADALSRIAKQNQLRLRTCAEAVELQKYGIEHGCCIDGAKIAEIAGWSLSVKKDANQRKECGCVESVDIGQYNTCRHGCKYCYANFNPQSVITFSQKHDPQSPFLVGSLEPEDKVTERKMKSLKRDNFWQMPMF